MPKISIIVPVYNVEKYLDRCVQSILNQTYSDFELILVDDGSPDRCPELCDDWEKKDSRIKVVHKENGGLSSARNAGLDASSAPFVSFVDSDDWLAADIYEVAMELQHEYCADMVAFSMKKTFDDVENADELQMNPEVFVMPGKDWIPRLYQDLPSPGVIACNKIFKRELFQHIRFTEGRIYEDTLILPKLLYAANCCVVTTHIGYFYYQANGSSIMHEKFSLKTLDKDYAFQDNRDFYIKHNLTEAFLWNDTTYAFILIRLLRNIRKNYGSKHDSYAPMKKKYTVYFRDFLNNPYFIWKQKLLLIWYRLVL